jgi:hypothetical protein
MMIDFIKICIIISRKINMYLNIMIDNTANYNDVFRKKHYDIYVI